MTIDRRAVAGDAIVEVANPATESAVGSAPDCSEAQRERRRGRGDGITRGMLTGTVFIDQTRYLSSFAPFGGLSGLGVEGGTEGLLEYTNAQTIVRRRSVRA